MLYFFPRDVLGGIWDLIGSVSGGFPTYFCSEKFYVFSILDPSRLTTTFKGCAHAQSSQNKIRVMNRLYRISHMSVASGSSRASA